MIVQNVKRLQNNCNKHTVGISMSVSNEKLTNLSKIKTVTFPYNGSVYNELRKHGGESTGSISWKLWTKV